MHVFLHFLMCSLQESTSKTLPDFTLPTRQLLIVRILQWLHKIVSIILLLKCILLSC